MKLYECKPWTMRYLCLAMKGEDSQGRKITIPIFQRGKRWKDDKREKFIESLLLGYPVGTLLFAERDNKTYSIIDGLQRTTTITEYISNPTKRSNLKNVDDEVLTQCRLTLYPGSINITINNAINECILDEIAKSQNYDTIEVFGLAQAIFLKFPSTDNNPLKLINELSDILRPWFTKYKSDYNTILETEIPVVIYNGNQSNLHEIFERINKQGEPLTDYEIYAASWRQDKYKINNTEIVDYVIKKYDSLLLDGYKLEDYNQIEMKRSKELTAFEYLFGLGKYLIAKFDFLNLESEKQDSEVSPIGFELIDVCLNNTKRIAELSNIFYDRFYEKNADLNLLERRIKESIEFVYSAVSPICDFKGNKRKKQYLHPKYFILAFIAFVLHEMYDINDLSHKKDDWQNKRDLVYSRIKHHYVYGLVENEWHDGGIGKMYSAVKNRDFMEEISYDSWNKLLDSYFNKSLMAKEKQKFGNPTNADSVLLNCIYLQIFTANDQLANSVFDIEHLATKERMRKLIEESNCDGLPISSIANQCYLPQNINRGKKDKTIYEASKLAVSLDIIEQKYSFTKASDFDFIYLPYDSGSASILEEEYKKFLEKRFSAQKQKVLQFLGFNLNSN